MNDDRPIPDESAGSFVVSPDSVRLREGRCSAEKTPQQFQAVAHPPRLIDRFRVSIDARDEKDDEDRLLWVRVERALRMSIDINRTTYSGELQTGRTVTVLASLKAGSACVAKRVPRLR